MENAINSNEVPVVATDDVTMTNDGFLLYDTTEGDIHYPNNTTTIGQYNSVFEPVARRIGEGSHIDLGSDNGVVNNKKKRIRKRK